MMNSKRIIAKASPILLLLLIVVFCVSAIVFFSRFGKKDERISFSTVGWNRPMTDSEGFFTGTRLKMVDNLLKRYDFHGWSRQEVQSLLGKPEYEELEGQKYFIKYDLRDNLNMLIFEVDNQHKVLDYYVYRED
jgi:hypothetical protein